MPQASPPTSPNTWPARSPTCKRSGFRGLTGLPARGPQPADSLPRCPEQPVLDTARAQQLAGGVSDVAAGRALTTLEDHGILSRVTKRVRGRVWEAGELFELITDFEEDLANLRLCSEDS
jgi:hypothetical protein